MATTTARKTPRKTAAPAPARRPLVDLTVDAHDPDAVEQLDLFEVDGVMYTIPASSSASVLIEYMRLEEDKGGDAPMWWLFNKLLGEDGVKAMTGYAGLTRTHIRQLHLACLDTITGPKGR